jgi:hypothetical protein
MEHTMLLSIQDTWAPWRRTWTWLRRRCTAARSRYERRSEAAAFEACAPEGADMEFQLIEIDGHPFGAVYIDGKLNCLLPQLRSL